MSISQWPRPGIKELKLKATLVEKSYEDSKDAISPVCALDHFPVDAGTEDTGSHRELLLQRGRPHHQRRPWAWEVGAIVCHFRRDCPTKREDLGQLH